MQNNVLYDELPTEFNGYKVNTDFQIGVQILCAMDDKELSDEDKAKTIAYLLFYDDELEELREYPQDVNELETLIQWYINGWNHDNHKKQADKQRVMDFYIDQWRIYADFRQIYNINLNDAQMHFWEFMALLWNMPYKLSSFLQVVEMRQRKPSKKASNEERKAIADAQETYGLEQAKPELSDEDKSKIDEYDRMMEEIKRKKKLNKEIESIMMNKS